MSYIILEADCLCGAKFLILDVQRSAKLKTWQIRKLKKDAKRNSRKFIQFSTSPSKCPSCERMIDLSKPHEKYKDEGHGRIRV